MGRPVMNVRASREQGNLSDPPWSLSLPAASLSRAVHRRKVVFFHTPA